jgi:adrenodoxin-NADP+ reductase
VAPDHPEVKNVINTFESVANNTRVRFIGDVTIGQDVPVQAITDAYDATVLCYGAATDNKLAIPGVVSMKRLSFSD